MKLAVVCDEGSNNLRLFSQILDDVDKTENDTSENGNISNVKINNFIKI